ncbi:hypothetical protein SLS62_006086 [Diatrype stigma]|uniref:Uncharacterized protein n=1 Tax=Diatrype stigma TaxID=117547 RepID=A0AAN9V1P6_9PEZI
MSWDSSKSVTRRRQNSSANASSRALPPGHARPQQQSKQPVQPRSQHVADPFLQSFLSPAFDPAEYLNASLPPLQTPGTSRAAATDGAAVPLADLSAQAQTQLSQLNAHTTRLANTLTQLTDDILRSGSRLAYEVELLRGETLGLSEALSEGLHQDIVKFVPDGIIHPARTAVDGSGKTTDAAAAVQQKRVSAVLTTPSPSGNNPDDGVSPPPAAADGGEDTSSLPSYITQLRTLTLVRSRLDSVVRTFGDAMEFVFPPSELSVSSSFLSVSAPEPGQEAHSTEEKGQQVLRKLREEIADMLAANRSDPIEGIDRAARRIEELKELAAVWKGTAEEKGRAKFIDSLAKAVEDRHKELLREMEQSGRRDTGRGDANGGSSHSNGNAALRKGAGNTETGGAESKAPTGYGLISQWQRLRTGL